jgi:hypothetical protein
MNEEEATLRARSKYSLEGWKSPMVEELTKKQTITVACALCKWTRTGPSKTVLAAQKKHRLKHQ